VLKLPASVEPVKVGAVLGSWLRARIVNGGFGGEVSYRSAVDPNDSTKIPYIHPKTGNPLFELVSAAAVPPLVEWLRLGFTRASAPEHAFLRHGPLLHNVMVQAGGMPGPFRPFEAPSVPEPALYLGFDAPFANGPVALYVGVEPRPAAESVTAAPPMALELAWEYAAREGDWRDLLVVDDTGAFSVSGLVSFIGPADMAAQTLFERTHFWLRVRCIRGDDQARELLRLGRVLTNTTWAVHARAVDGEVLGSSDGSQPGLTLHVSAPPVLPGQVVEVREAPEAGWSVWDEQLNLYAAGPWDRHYVLDRLSGELRFGDGARGMVPPRGSNNIRISYSTGGGAEGNLPAGAISQLKVAVPYVDGVTSHEPAAGGADAEPAARARERGPRELRHSWRAVAAQDFEDLALAATPEVARALAITPYVDPIYEQWAITVTEEEAAAKAGWVRLVIVPHGDGPAPMPTPELLRRVERFIDARRAPQVEFDILPPVYVTVDVSVAVSVRTPEDGEGLIDRLKAVISHYLHPLSGGPDGRGWPFGRLANAETGVMALRSDLYALIAATPGVDRVRDVVVTLGASSLKGDQWTYALLSPGTPLVTLA
jgi:hypothetical protein